MCRISFILFIIKKLFINSSAELLFPIQQIKMYKRITSAYCKLINSKQVYSNISNYGEKPHKECVTRFHNRFRYDEYRTLSTNKILQKAMIAQEKQHFEGLKEHFNPHFEKYFSKSSKRTDSRHAELPELYDDYFYFSKFSYIDDKEYQVIYRRHRLNNQEEVVLDLKEIPFVTRKYWSTASLAKIALSDDHKYVAFCS